MTKLIIVAAQHVVGVVTELSRNYATYSRAVATDGSWPNEEFCEEFRRIQFMGYVHYDGSVPGEWTIRVSKRPGYRHSEDMSLHFIWTPWVEALNRLPDSILVLRADVLKLFLHICEESKIATQVYECGEVHITPSLEKRNAA